MGNSTDRYLQTTVVHTNSFTGRSINRRLPPLAQSSGDVTIRIGYGWLVRYTWVELGLPLGIASALLQDFYQKLLERIKACINPGEVVAAISLGIHDLYLDFYQRLRCYLLGYH